MEWFGRTKEAVVSDYSESYASITNEGEYRAVQSALSHRNRPHVILRYLMNLFEEYRQARRIGWSRPWNKAGVRTFLAFKMDVEDELFPAKVLDALPRDGIPEEGLSLARELAARPEMAFLFLSEIEEGGRRFESATLSLGRVNASNRRCRDRVDVILDAEIVGARCMGLTRVRVFVDPYRGPKAGEWSVTTSATPVLRQLAGELRLRAAGWAVRGERVWNHWTSDYIDYFGPAEWSVENPWLPRSVGPFLQPSSEAGAAAGAG